jgi:hypothetical protein
MKESEDINSNEINDLVMIPKSFLPINVLRLITKEGNYAKITEYDFYTDALGGEGLFYYIDNLGRLVFRDMNISIGVVGKSVDLILDTDHKVVIEPLPDKVYSVINNKFCTLELHFEEGILQQIKSYL